jgi:hypothetical protein
MVTLINYKLSYKEKLRISPQHIRKIAQVSLYSLYYIFAFHDGHAQRLDVNGGAKDVLLETSKHQRHETGRHNDCRQTHTHAHTHTHTIFVRLRCLGKVRFQVIRMIQSSYRMEPQVFSFPARLHISLPSSSSTNRFQKHAKEPILFGPVERVHSAISGVSAKFFESVKLSNRTNRSQKIVDVHQDYS